MPEVTAHAPGTPSWIDLMTPSPAEDAAFYAGLFDWTYEPVPGKPGLTGGYGTFKLRGTNVAGVGPIIGEGMPPNWGTYIATDNAAAAAEKVKANGGRVIMEPMQVLDSGHMATCADPAGAFFRVWQPLSHIGAELVNEPGALVWNELNTRDVAGSKAFYSAVFGWQPQQGPREDYTMFNLDGKTVAGMIDMDLVHVPEGVPPYWSVYIGVDDCDATVAKSTELGGGVIVPAFDVPVGRMAVLSDPVGAAISIVAMNNPM